MAADPVTVVAALSAHLPADPGLPGRTAHARLAAAILLPGTSREQVIRLLGVLDEVLPGPAGWATAEPAVLERLLGRLPQRRQRARALREAGRRLVARHGGTLTPLALQDLPGLTRAALQAVAWSAFGLPGLPLDADARRVCSRLGWGDRRSQQENLLTRALPQETWATAGLRLAELGRSRCRPLVPRCARCPLAGVCERANSQGG